MISVVAAQDESGPTFAPMKNGRRVVLVLPLEFEV
jgi:hypothetical protein